MILDGPTIDPAALAARTGWEIKPEGACKDTRCVPLPDGALDDPARLAERLGMACVEHDGLIALGPDTTTGRTLASAELPNIELPDRDGTPFAPRSLRGKKVFLLAWASWCGCRLELKAWNALREELHPHGFEVVTVALDTGGAHAAGPWIDRASPTHPSLVDRAHVLDELLGVVNVPTGIPVDEDGMLVRPPEVAFPEKTGLSEMKPAKDVEIPALLKEQFKAAMKIPHDRGAYVCALRGWVTGHDEAGFALAPDEVVVRSAPRDLEDSAAAAHFELGQHLWRAGDEGGAVPHFREAHRLAPDNWTYKRQAWSFADPDQGPTEEYESDWLTDIRRTGPDRYYRYAEFG